MSKRRIDLIREMPILNLAAYLAAELNDSLPTNWLSWLLEVVEVENE